MLPMMPARSQQQQKLQLLQHPLSPAASTSAVKLAQCHRGLRHSLPPATLQLPGGRLGHIELAALASLERRRPCRRRMLLAGWVPASGLMRLRCLPCGLVPLPPMFCSRTQQQQQQKQH